MKVSQEENNKLSDAIDQMQVSLDVFIDLYNQSEEDTFNVQLDDEVIELIQKNKTKENLKMKHEVFRGNGTLDIHSILHTLTEKIKAAIRGIQKHKEKLSISEIAAFIIENPNTVKTRQQYLGIILHEYNLRIDDIDMQVETKGASSEKILSVNIFSDGIPILQYRSYDPQAQLNKKISLPESVLH